MSVILAPTVIESSSRISSLPLFYLEKMLIECDPGTAPLNLRVTVFAS
jgi:hypothetical protein